MAASQLNCPNYLIVEAPSNPLLILSFERQGKRDIQYVQKKSAKKMIHHFQFAMTPIKQMHNQACANGNCT